MFKKLVITAALTSVSLMAQNSAEINLNSYDIELLGKYQLGQNFDYNGNSNANYIHLGYLYSGESETRSKELVEGGYIATGAVGGLNALSFGIGIKASTAEEFVAIPIGATINYRLPVNWPVNIGASVYIAPDPLVFLDGKGYTSYRFGVSTQIIPNASIYAGYRDINLKYKDSLKNFNDGWYIGVRFYF